MNLSINKRVNVFLITILLFGTCLLPLTITQPLNQIPERPLKINEGNILFAPMQSLITYLIDSNGNINHTWTSDKTPGESAYMLEDGSILRTIKLSFSGGGAGGGVQKITWEDEIIWDFRYYTNDYLSHHDIELLPNGNILMIAWEYKTRNEAIQAGRDPNKLNANTLWPDHVIEVKPTGPTSGEIVWEWYVWDHLIQDYDPSKDNYGTVADHPELIDINFGRVFSDWLHTNSIDYNEEFDQILLSVHEFNEIWVIDHSTTTEEAAGHTGGNSGKGGDLLYRWGNPQAYRAGTSSDKKFFGQHDARWISPDCPGEGNILVFNNGLGRPGGYYSSVDEIVPPVDNNGSYYLETGSKYGPEEQIWIYDTNFYAYFISGAQRCPNGNTLVCNGPEGIIFEVTPEKVIVWEYENQYPNPFQNNIFKCEYYYPKEPPPPDKPDLDCVGSLEWNSVEAGEEVVGNFKVKNIGEASSLLDWIIKSAPEWGDWTFYPSSGMNLTPEDGELIVQVSVIAPDVQNSEFEGYIRVENQEDAKDYDLIPVHLTTPREKTINTLLINQLRHSQNIIHMLYLLMKLLGSKSK